MMSIARDVLGGHGGGDGKGKGEDKGSLGLDKGKDKDNGKGKGELSLYWIQGKGKNMAAAPEVVEEVAEEVAAVAADDVFPDYVVHRPPFRDGVLQVASCLIVEVKAQHQSAVQEAAVGLAHGTDLGPPPSSPTVEGDATYSKSDGVGQRSLYKIVWPTPDGTPRGKWLFIEPIIIQVNGLRCSAWLRFRRLGR
jgi:hypothetical protein